MLSILWLSRSAFDVEGFTKWGPLSACADIVKYTYSDTLRYICLEFINKMHIQMKASSLLKKRKSREILEILYS